MIVLPGNAGVLAPGRWRWLRAIGWMVLLFAVTSLLFYPFWRRLGGADPRFLRLLTIVAGYGLYALAVRWGERRRATEIALHPLLPELATGAAVGAGMFALVFAVLRFAGAYTLAPGTWGDWGDDVFDALATGFVEELLLRLIIFRLLARAFGTTAALLLSAALFGLLHLGNANASLVAAIAIALEAGLMLAAFYLLTGRIWTAVGVHAAWNFMQGPVFGARVSGGSDAGSLFVSAPVRGTPDWLSGGAFGPEASVVAILVGLAVFALVMARARTRQGAVRSG